MVRRFTFGRSAIMIISYETFRIHQALFRKGNQCGLLICDEAHRLKNKDTKTAVALSALPTARPTGGRRRPRSRMRSWRARSRS